jgi:predicted transposase YdaD
MSRYAILKDTWIYQEIKQEIQIEEREGRLQEQRQILQEIVQVRFPRLTSLAEQVSTRLTDLEVLRNLIVRVGIAKAEKEARQSLSDA